jgi:ammonia channel protein AmtB
LGKGMVRLKNVIEIFNVQRRQLGILIIIYSRGNYWFMVGMYEDKWWGSGMRDGEFLGVRWKGADADFQKQKRGRRK